MPRPSFLWIYGLIGAFILGYYFFNPTNDQPIKSDWTLVGSMIAQGDVERVQIVGESRALIFLKKGAVEKYRNAPENKNKQLAEMLDIDIFATDVYTLGYEYESKANLDFTNNMIITN